MIKSIILMSSLMTSSPFGAPASSCEKPEQPLTPVDIGPPMRYAPDSRFVPADIVLAVRVRADGSVNSVSVVCHTSPIRQMPQLAMRHVKRWTFAPRKSDYEGSVLVTFRDPREDRKPRSSWRWASEWLQRALCMSGLHCRKPVTSR